MTNHDIARRLQEHASLLARSGHNLYRVRAFRQAAFAVLRLPSEVAAIGVDELRHVPGIGKQLAGTISDYATKGVWPFQSPDKPTLIPDKR